MDRLAPDRRCRRPWTFELRYNGTRADATNNMMVTNARTPGSSYTLAAESRVQLSKWLAAFGRMAMEAQKVQSNLASVPQRLCMRNALFFILFSDRQAGGTGTLEMPTVAAVRSASKADRLFYDVTAEGQMDVNIRAADKQAAAVKPGLLEVTDTHARFWCEPIVIGGIRALRVWYQKLHVFVRPIATAALLGSRLQKDANRLNFRSDWSKWCKRPAVE